MRTLPGSSSDDLLVSLALVSEGSDISDEISDIFQALKLVFS